jgi:hypothetical protein
MKPGTPLPWRVVERKNARGQELTPAIIGKRSYETSREWPIAVASAISKEETDGNAAYIAHSANAYPRLVAALHEIIGSGAASRHAKVGEAAFLLRDLGEMS